MSDARDQASTGATPAYRVLARKYRPETFADLIGQEAMVRTLRNAFLADRIHHAFILTGIRGTGKTTTARIVAKGLNCIGADGKGRPTTDPCGVCEHCRAISEGRHVDVLEMDAASRTGVDDIRDIIDSVAYRAASARFKVYIIDEVHMLSRNAFNALLKTLEEPPAHVKFIFATTEIRKVPVTVLSRCQRFDLRRIEPETMLDHLDRIAGAEGAQVTAEALALITRAAEGSVRDALSLLDQAISHGGGETGADQVRAMLGLADRGRVLDLFDRIMAGDPAAALRELAAQYADGADPAAVLRDLAEIAHWISVAKVTPEAAEDPTVAPDERVRGIAMAERLPMRVLARAWQMLLRAIEEVAQAPNAMMAAEMAVIRLTHVADLPSPEELVRRLGEPGGGGGPVARSGGVGGGGTAGSGAAGMLPAAYALRAAQAGGQGGGAMAALAVQPAQSLSAWPRFGDVVALIRERRDVPLLIEVESCLRLVRYSPGRIEFEPTPAAPPDLAARLAQRLQTWTGARWAVSVTGSGGAPTLAETRAAEEDDARAVARRHPLVAAVFESFSSARIADVRSLVDAEAEASSAALPAVEEPEDPDWDPFADD